MTHFVTAIMYKLLCLTWKKEVEPSVMIGERTSGLETTCTLNISLIDRLYNVKKIRKLTAF